MKTITAFLIIVIIIFTCLNSACSQPDLQQPSTEVIGNAPDFIQSRTDFEESKFCQLYGCVHSGNHQFSDGRDYNMYVVENYPNRYDDILIELIGKEDDLIEFGVVLDGMPPTRPNLSSEDFQFLYDFISSISNQNDLDPTVQEYLRQNIEIDVSQICSMEPLDYGSMRLWAGKIITPSILISKICPK